MSKETALADGALIVTARHLKLFSLDDLAHAPSEVTFANKGTEHKFTARPSRLHLGEDGGALFGHAAEDAASELVSNSTEDRRAPKKFFLNMFKDSAKLARGAVSVLLAAGLVVALMIDPTASIRCQAVFAAFSTPSETYPLNFHADDFQGGLLRSVHVSSGSPDSHVVFGISAFNWSHDPLLKETFIGGVNVGGLLCYAKELIKAGETYLLNRESAGDVVLFFLKVEVDGVDVYVPFKRVHAVPPVEMERHALITTYFSREEGLDDETMWRSLAALARPVRPRSAASLASGYGTAAPVPVGGSLGFNYGRVCAVCYKECSGLFVPGPDAPKGPVMCPSCVLGKDALRHYVRCPRDKCAECPHGYAKVTGASGKQLCGPCGNGCPGFQPKYLADRCLIAGCGRTKCYVEVNSSGGPGYCPEHVPNKVHWRNRIATNHDGTLRVRYARAKLKLSDDGLTQEQEEGLLGGPRALASFYRRAHAGEFSVVSWRDVADMLTKEYHYGVPRLLFEDLEDISDEEWTRLSSGRYETRYRRLVALLADEVGIGEFKEAQKRKKADAKAAEKVAKKRKAAT
mgnify:CR=1 FL=1